MSGVAKKAAVPAWKAAYVRWGYNHSYFNQLGLRHNDIISQTPIVLEAIRRLSPEIRDERNFRMARALLLSGNKRILPKEEWTNYDEDEPYLKPLIELVQKEQDEKDAWNKQ